MPFPALGPRVGTGRSPCGSQDAQSIFFLKFSRISEKSGENETCSRPLVGNVLVLSRVERLCVCTICSALADPFPKLAIANPNQSYLPPILQPPNPEPVTVSTKDR